MYQVWLDNDNRKYCEVDAICVEKYYHGKYKEQCMTIYFNCPFCSVFVRSNGKPRIRPKLYKHQHGLTEDDLKRGYTYKSPHCICNFDLPENHHGYGKMNFPDDFRSFKINITKNTIITKK